MREPPTYVAPTVETYPSNLTADEKVWETVLKFLNSFLQAVLMLMVILILFYSLKVLFSS